MTRIVFLDTAGLLALTNRDDALFGAARRVNAELATAGATLITSDWVLSELLGAAARPALRESACALVRRLQISHRTTLVPATRPDWERAFKLFSARPDKEWSLVDCSSMLICEQLEIREVFTHDRHFTQAGLTILL